MEPTSRGVEPCRAMIVASAAGWPFCAACSIAAQKRRSKALGLRAGVFHFHDLRQNGQRDLFGCFGPDGKSDGGLHSFHPCSIRPSFQQLSPYQCGPAPAAHHANVSRRFLQDLLQAGHIKGMGAGHDHKVGLCPAGHLLQCLCKR